MREVVAELARRAMTKADEGRPEKLKAGVALAELLNQAGYHYDYKAIQAWGRGDSNPPAWAFLEAMRLTGVSLDEEVFSESLLARMGRLERGLQDLRNDLGKS